MKKFFRILYSQIFNSFFPIIIIALLIKLVDNNRTASIFLLLNFSNIYLLFSDYSSNTILLKDALQSGGIFKGKVPLKIIKDIEVYIGVKIIVLAIGFLFWIALCLLVPQLSKHAFSNILAYTFIVGNNLNFYWLYMSSSKEYFFIISNFLGRVFFLLLLVIFILCRIDFFSLMPLTGLGIFVISLVTFKRFCKVYHFGIKTSNETIRMAGSVIRRDWPLVANSFLFMTPTNCLSIFIGFIKNSSHVLVYGFAEKIFMAIRSLLGVFVNSVYPIICQEGSVTTKKSKNILLLFYTVVISGCGLAYFLSPWVFQYLNQPASLNLLFTRCLIYFLITAVIISINTRYYLQLLVTNHFNDTKSFGWLFVTSMVIVAMFVINIYFDNNVISIVQSVMAAEIIIVLGFVILTNFTRSKITSKPIEPTMKDVF